MAKTKAQKLDIVEKANEELAAAKTLVFADFGGTSMQDLKSLRTALRAVDARFQVIKKRLLKLVLSGKLLDFDPKQFDGPVGTIFAKNDISEVAQSLYKFSKDKPNFKILGGMNLEKGEAISGETVKAIGQLPPREILLGQLMGMMTAPLRAFMYILQEKSKRSQSV
ncbi:MAG: 50S ribosomal protein L10 [Candidatus Colwellbacteria bacterium]|nr:50S ribosomal protein L10 [Candidatus Colwellbacteria bacterium]